MCDGRAQWVKQAVWSKDVRSEESRAMTNFLFFIWQWQTWALTLPLIYIWWRHQAATSNSYRNGNAMTLPQILSTPSYGIKLSRVRATLLINSLSPIPQFVMGSMEVGKTKNFWCDKCCNVLLSRPSVVMDVTIYEERWGKCRGKSRVRPSVRPFTGHTHEKLSFIAVQRRNKE